MIDAQTYSIFKRGSTTYFYSSLFFPENKKSDVFALYRFVREADNLVDSIPAKAGEFLQFRDDTLNALAGGSTSNPTISKFVRLTGKYNFDSKWTKAFLDSMESDLKSISYNTIEEVEKYMFGSAEVIGLYMANVLNLPQESTPYAKLLGKSMQYANFIRDIQEDLDLNRSYLPKAELKKVGLKSLEYQDIINHQQQFKEFIRQQVNQYSIWQREAEQGFKYIPYRYKVPIQTASDMYKWTMERISKNPLMVYRQQLKPHPSRIVSRILRNSIKGLSNGI